MPEEAARKQNWPVIAEVTGFQKCSILTFTHFIDPYGAFCGVMCEPFFNFPWQVIWRIDPSPSSAEECEGTGRQVAVVDWLTMAALCRSGRFNQGFTLATSPSH